MTASAQGPAAVEQTGDRPRRRAFVHVGAPKTGTTYLQGVLWANRRTLARGGLLYPGSYDGAHHNAALELRSAAFGGHRNPNMVAAWDRLVAEADGWDGDLLISSELLAWATPEQARRALESLAGFEVHVLFTARDLARQVPAVWQEEMKNRRLMSYQDFLRDLLDPESPEDGPAGIWGGQDPRLVMRGWGADLPPEQVHVITVPASGGPSDELWRRFCSVVGLDPEAYDLDVRTSNVGLGFAEAEMLRRVNEDLPESFEWPAYRVLVKHGISEDPLATRQRAGKPPLPDEVAAALAERTRGIVDHVRERGFAITGDLAELDLPGQPGGTGLDDVVVEETHVAAAGVDSVVVLLERLRRTRRELVQAYDELGVDYQESRTEEENLDAEEDAEEEPEPPPPLAPFAGEVDLSPRHRPAHARNKTVFLVVGSPKTGLDRVRDVLWRSRESLAQQDVHLPLSGHEHFLATLDLRDVIHENPEAEGAWTRLTDSLSQTRSGTWVIAHELFAPVTTARATAAMRRLAPAEVHVVVVARGLERQIPAEWLESLRHGSVTPFGHYADHAVQSLDQRPHVPWFWQVQDPVDIAERWGASLSPGRVHVITSPGGVTDADEQLWLRLCAVIGIDPTSADTSPLGAPAEPRPVDAEVLRRLNLQLREQEWAVAGDPPHPTPAYGRTMRDVVANQVMAQVPEPHTVALPAAYDVWLARQARTLTAELRAKRYDVVGDVAELHPLSVHRPDNARPPERFSDRVVLPAALETVVGASNRMLALIEEVDRLRPQLAELTEERDRLQAQVDRLTGPMRAGRKVFNAVRGTERR